MANDFMAKPSDTEGQGRTWTRAVGRKGMLSMQVEWSFLSVGHGGQRPTLREREACLDRLVGFKVGHKGTEIALVHSTLFFFFH